MKGPNRDRVDSIHSSPPEWVVTEDGSLTLYDPHVDETFHSTHGARTESQYIFVEQALARSEADPVRVLEVGWGTGLNGLLSLLYAQKERVRVEYISMEKYPLEAEVWGNYATKLEDPIERELMAALHRVDWGQAVGIGEYFTIRKLRMDALDISPEITGPVDVIYMDAFSPEKVPELWSEEMMGRLYACGSQGCILSTYCAKGEVRRRLQRVGFEVVRTAGPPGGKREILVAHKR